MFSGATTLTLRRAFDVTGPYTKAQTLLFPPESMAPGAVVYGGKGHIQLGGSHEVEDGSVIYDLIVTFTNSSFVFLDLLDDKNAHALFFPHFVGVAFVFPAC